MGSKGKETESIDKFPVGMRVLAVDDDPTCLKLLENLLLRCHYNVTTASEAIVALKLLRENKEKFDLVISDVHMPDMDGFELLEVVGLEMDLPVIMLSADGDTKAVMKGIIHGACDYLLKPIRLEEVKNIWQHVVRRKQSDRGGYRDNGESSLKAQLPNSEGMKGLGDPSGKPNRRRKDRAEEDDGDCEEDIPEKGDHSTQKKQRVVWSIELHRKFVVAVNQLGIDKAVPKKILDLMNVEKLTRENVASHLQKYRLYLKRLSIVANPQNNMATILGGQNSPYMSSFDGSRNFHALGGSRQVPVPASFQPNGLLGRMNSSTAFGMHGLLPSQTVQFHGTQNNTSNPTNDLRKLQGISLLGNHQGMPTTMELDQLQQPKVAQETNNIFPSGFSSSGLAYGLCSNSFANMTNNPLSVQANVDQTQAVGLASCSFVRMPFSNSDSLENCFGGCSQYSDLVRCDDAWQDALPSIDYCASALPIHAPLSNNCSSTSNIGGSVSPIISIMDGDIHGQSSICVAAPMNDSVIGNDVHSQVGSLGGSMMPIPMDANEDPKFSDFRGSDKSKKNWEEQKQNHSFNSNVIMFSSSLNSSLPHLHMNDPVSNQILSNGIGNTKMDTNVIGQTDLDSPNLTQDCRIEKSTDNGQLIYKDEYALNTAKLQCVLSSADCSYDEVVDGQLNANMSST